MMLRRAYRVLDTPGVGELILLCALAVLFLTSCHHVPPVVVPPTPTPTPSATATPTPEPTPDWSEFGPRRYFFWGADGARAEQATQVSVWRQEVRPLCGPFMKKCSPMHGDQEARLSVGDSWDQVKARMRQWFKARVTDGEQVWVGLDWAGLVLGADGEVVKADLIPDIIDIYAEYWDHVAAVWLDGESGLTGAQLDAKARYVLKLMRERGLARKKFTVDVLEHELWSMRPQDATLVDVWMFEGYDAGKGSGNRAEDRRLVQEALTRQLALLPAGSHFGVWPASYDRNKVWAQSKEDLAAVTTHAVEWIVNLPPADRARCVIVAFFCWVRAGNCDGGYCGGGARDYPLIAQQIKRGIAWLETGNDPGPAVPASEEPTPAPTPEPNAVGVFVNGSQGCLATGNPPSCSLGIERRGVGSQAVPATIDVWTEAIAGWDSCWAGEQSGTLTYAPGVKSQSVKVILKPGTAHCEVLLHKGNPVGAPYYPGEAPQHATWNPPGPGVGWFKTEFASSVPMGAIEAYGATKAQAVEVCLHTVDLAGKSGKVRCVVKAAGASTVPALVPVTGHGALGTICLDSARTKDTGTPVAIIGPKCVEYAGQ